MERETSLVKVDKHAANISGEMSLVSGILSSRSSTRSLADKRNLGNPGNRMPSSQIFCRRGTRPPKNALGRAGLGAVSPHDWTRRYVSIGNGFCIAMVPTKEYVRPESEIRCTRSWCPSAVTRSPQSSGTAGCDLALGRSRYSMIMGKAGHTSSALLTGVFSVQSSRRSRAFCDARTVRRHAWHT